MSDRWASSIDPGYLGDKYQNLLDVHSSIQSLQKRTYEFTSMQGNNWFDAWTLTANKFVHHCLALASREARAEDTDLPLDKLNLKKAKDENALRTEALGAAYLMAKYNMERAPLPTDCRAEFNYKMEEVNRSIETYCAEELASSTKYMQQVMDERERLLQQQQRQ